MTRNIILVAHLKQFCIIHVYQNDIFYFEARHLDGICEVKLDNSSKNSSIFHTSTKKLKHI